MAKILISGLLNLETTARTRGFPIQYYPVDYTFFGVSSTLSGVALNIAKALSKLGDSVSLASLTGNDLTSRFFLEEIKNLGISTDHILQKLRETPASVVLYDESGRRQIYCDLKDIQETDHEFTEEMVAEADAVVACNINFSRPLLDMARAGNKLIATDVHVLTNPDDDYNREFMEKADILFLSDEGITWNKHDFVRALGERYHNRIIVLGMGASGALLHMPHDNLMVERPACKIGNVINTVGAGDALFSAFLHFYLKGADPVSALASAQLFAALKIRHAGAAEGFVTEAEIEEKKAEQKISDKACSINGGDQ